jgi:hypothetical protein
MASQPAKRPAEDDDGCVNKAADEGRIILVVCIVSTTLLFGSLLKGSDWYLGVWTTARCTSYDHKVLRDR